MPSRASSSAALLLALLLRAAGSAAPRRNVVFIVLDDARADMSAAYNQTHVSTPHMDALATSGATFTRAYVQATYCVPSRASFLTGFRPERTGIDNLNYSVWGDQDFRAALGHDVVTLPEHFKRSGWRTVGLGKIFHSKGTQEAESSRAFSEKPYHPRRHQRTMCDNSRPYVSDEGPRTADLSATHSTHPAHRPPSTAPRG